MKVAGSITIHGCPGGVVVGSILASGKSKLADMDYGDGADAGETKTGNNDFLSITSSGNTTRCTVTLIPYEYHATAATAAAALVTLKAGLDLPEKMSKVTISGTGITKIDGDWHYSRSGGGSIKPDPSGQALRITLPLERFDTGDGIPKYIGDPVAVP